MAGRGKCPSFGPAEVATRALFGIVLRISPQLSQRFRDTPAAQFIPSKSTGPTSRPTALQTSPDFRRAVGRLPQALDQAIGHEGADSPLIRKI